MVDFWVHTFIFFSLYNICVSNLNQINYESKCLGLYNVLWESEMMGQIRLNEIYLASFFELICWQIARYKLMKLVFISLRAWHYTRFPSRPGVDVFQLSLLFSNRRKIFEIYQHQVCGRIFYINCARSFVLGIVNGHR